MGFGSKNDRRHLERWRDKTDATLLGAGSLRAGDPEFRDSSGKIPTRRIRALITMSEHLPLEKSIFKRGPRPFVFCSHNNANALKRNLSESAKIFPVAFSPQGGLDLFEVLDILEQHGVKKLLIEGGGRLNYFALKQEVVHELVITVAPKLLISNTGIPLVNGTEDLGDPFLDLELVTCKTDLSTGEIYLRYKIKKENKSG